MCNEYIANLFYQRDLLTVRILTSFNPKNKKNSLIKKYTSNIHLEIFFH